MVLTAPGSDPRGRPQAKSKPPARPAQPLGSAANPQEQTIAEKVEAMKRELSVRAGSTFEATVQAADEDISREATVKMAKLIDLQKVAYPSSKQKMCPLNSFPCLSSVF